MTASRRFADQEQAPTPSSRPGEPADACPFTRPFAPGFSLCAGFAPIDFTTLDLRHSPTQPILTCANLVVGTIRNGAHYGRCALGGARPPEP